jgi:hypothetical protein
MIAASKYYAQNLSCDKHLHDGHVENLVHTELCRETDEK